MLDDLPDQGSGCLVDDAYVAKRLSMSRSWVRKQRFNRRHGLPHVFDIGPVLIGKVPRYRLEDVLAWIEAQKPEKSSLPGVGDSKDTEVAPKAADNLLISKHFGLPMLEKLCPDRVPFKPTVKDDEELYKEGLELLKELDSFVKEGGSL